METSYQIVSVDDFDRFLVDLTQALMTAAPRTWPVIKIELDKIVTDTRAELSLTLKKRPKTYYLIDASDRAAWEQEDRMFGRAIVVQVREA